ncbi:MAG: hypothetical protein Alpg2KO_13130 [Alphaproteobacteria bacterium]
MTNTAQNETVLILTNANGVPLGRLKVEAGTGKLSLMQAPDGEAGLVLAGIIADIEQSSSLPVLSDGGMPMMGMTMTAMDMVAPGHDNYPAAVAGYLRLKGINVD